MKKNKELWKDIEGYKGLYQVSNLGRIKRLETTLLYKGKYPRNWKEKILTQNTNNAGYKKCHLSKDGKAKTPSVHRLVALAFIENVLVLPCVNHLDGNKENNSADNLEWCSYKENTKHAIESGLMGVDGFENPSAKLDINEVNRIKRLYRTGKFSQRKLSIVFGVSQNTIKNVVKGNTYKNVFEQIAYRKEVPNE